MHRETRMCSRLAILLIILVVATACAGNAAVGPLNEDLTRAAGATAAAQRTAEPTPVPTPVVNASLWDNDPLHNVQISYLGGDQAIPKIVGAENGDFFTAWFSNPDGDNYNLRLQRYDGGGNALWANNGLLVSDHPSMSWITDFALAIDPEGNPILVLQDVRAGPNNLYAYKISPDGEFLWGPEGIPLSNNDYFEAPAASAVVTADHLTFAWVRDLGDRSVVALQKLTQDGQNVWGDGGLILQGAPDESYTQPVITSGAGDYTIVVWGLQKEPGSQVMDLYAQKLDVNGSSVWNQGEPLLLAESVPFYIQPAVVSDGVGGAFVAWHTTDLKSYVQHINLNGFFSMAAGGAAVADSGSNLQILPQLQFSPESQSLFVFWMETDETQSLRGLSGQKMNVSGWRMWDENGLKFVPLSRAELSSITPLLAGYDIIVFYIQGNDDQDLNVLESQVKAMLINGAGVPFWGEQPAVLSSVMSPKASLSAAKILNQESIVAWVDMRDDNRDIYMQNLPQLVLFEQAHPASTFCSSHGGLIDYHFDDAGGGMDVCVFPDGSVCEEWAFYLGECQPGE